MSEEKLVPKLRFSGFADEWNEDYLNKLFDNSNERNFESLEVLSVTINNGVLKRSDLGSDRKNKDKKSMKHVLKGDLVYNPMFMWKGASGISSYEGITSADYIVLKSKNNVNPIFFSHLFQTEKSLNKFKNYSQGSLLERLRLMYPQFSDIKMAFPSYEEQEKIANLLTFVDNKLELIEKKYQTYLDFKKYLMQQIFTQKLRFNFNDAWKTVKIKDIFDERSEKGFLDLELLSVTLNDGVIKRSEIESKDNSNENKSNYKHVLPGDIVYNSMRMWQGASGVSPYEGIVSPAYTILIPKNVYSKYFGYYFKTNEMVYQFKKYSQGLTSDTWNLKYPLISEIKIKIPSIEEQKEITNVFEIMDEKIKILQNNIDELTTFKKGLLQQMFV